jgi:hypothetical protein
MQPMLLFWRSGLSIGLFTNVIFIFFISVFLIDSGPSAHDFRLNKLSVKTFFNPKRRCLATVIGSRNIANALKVAFTTLCGLAEPNDFANTS